MLFYSIIILIVIQRLTELYISKRNEDFLLKNGAVEFGQSHYKFLVILHTLFILSMIAEYNLKSGYFELNTINYLFLVFFAILQGARFWVINSLGKYWNTKIFRIKGSVLVSSGPYKYFKHPNYIIVVCEFFTIPLIFNLYFTAVIFSLLNAVVLFFRIREENKALEI